MAPKDRFCVEGPNGFRPRRHDLHDRRDGDLMGNSAVRSFLVVVSAPSLQLFGRFCKRQEPVRIQALGAKPAIEGFDACVVGGLTQP